MSEDSIEQLPKLDKNKLRMPDDKYFSSFKPLDPRNGSRFRLPIFFLLLGEKDWRKYLYFEEHTEDIDEAIDKNPETWALTVKICRNRKDFDFSKIHSKEDALKYAEY